MTDEEILRAALRVINSKIRATNSLNKKAYKKAYGIKGGLNGNSSRRRPRTKATAKAPNDGIQEIGRGPGVAGKGDQTDDSPQEIGS